MSRARRHQRIVEILTDGPVESQVALAGRLSDEGIAVTQATLSRDLTELGVVKGPDGYVLAVDGGGRGGGDESAGMRRAIRRELLDVGLAEVLVVLHTRPGYAHAVAVEIDRQPPPEVVGTVAGDDTICLAVRTRADAEALMDRLRDIAELD